MSAEDSLQQCFLAFVERDYQGCVRLGEPLLSASVPCLAHLVIASLQRLQSGDISREQSQPLIESVRGDLWHYPLVKMALGTEDPDTVIEYAGRNSELCEAHFYIGLRLATQGMLQEARLHFEECLATGYDSVEAGLARVELQWLDAGDEQAHALDENDERAKVQRVRAVSGPIVELLKQGDGERAIPHAREAVELARTELGENHAEFATCLNNLGAAYYFAEQFDKAAALYQQSIEILRKSLGERHPDYAEAINNLGALYHKQGDHERAEQNLRMAADIKRATLGSRHPALARTLESLGHVYVSLKRHADAQHCFEEALTILRETAGSDDAATIQVARALGDHHRTLGEYQSALPLLQETVQWQERHGDTTSAQHARCLNELASTLTAVGDFVDAEKRYNSARELYRKMYGMTDRRYATVLTNIALLYISTGRRDEAEALLRQANEIMRTVYGENSSQYAQSSTNLAGAYSATGNFAGAELLLRRAVEILREGTGAEEGLASALNQQAQIRFRQGNFKEAHELLRKAIESGASNPLHTANALNTQAVLLQKMGDAAGAKQLLRQAVELIRRGRGESSSELASMLSNLGALCQGAGDQTDALEAFRDALTIAQKIHPGDHSQQATCFNNIGVCFLAMRDFDAAIQFLAAAVNMYARLKDKANPLDVAQAFDNMAVLLCWKSQFDDAMYMAESGLEIRRLTLGESHPDFANALHNLGSIHATAGRNSEALTVLDQANELDMRTIGQAFSISSERQRFAFLREFRCRLDLYLSVVHILSTPEAAQHGLDLVLRRKSIESEAMSAQRDAVLAGRYPHLKAQLLEVRTLRTRIADAMLSGPGDTDAQAFQQQLEQLQEQRESHERELSRQIPEMDLQLKLLAADRRAVALALPEGYALVEYVRFNPLNFQARVAENDRQYLPARYMAFVLHAGKPDSLFMVDLGEAESIDRWIAEFRAGILGDGPQRGLGASPDRPQDFGFADAGVKLRAALFDPLRNAIADCEKLIIAPDGDLAQLPFEVLPDEHSGQLIDHYESHYVACGREVLRFNMPRVREPNASVVVADPDFDLLESESDRGQPLREGGCDSLSGRPPHSRQTSRSLDSTIVFGRLPGTSQEGQQVAKLLGVTPWLGQEALDARLTAVQSPQVLHIATHGFFLSDQQGESSDELRGLGAACIGPQRVRAFLGDLENPLLRSGLALAGANTWLSGGDLPDGAEDGLLTAEDVTGLDLIDTELVVLSACETGLGKVEIGEGVMGLRRSFGLAGASSLVISLWKVPDDQTQELMTVFYERLLDGTITTPSALRQAKLAIRERYPDPVYWGAFICHGAPTILKVSR